VIVDFFKKAKRDIERETLERKASERKRKLEEKRKELRRKTTELDRVATRLGRLKDEVAAARSRMLIAKMVLDSPQAVNAVVENPVVVKEKVKEELDRFREFSRIRSEDGLKPPRWVKFFVEVAVGLMGVILLWTLLGADRVVEAFEFLEVDDGSRWVYPLALLIDSLLVFGLVQVARSFFAGVFLTRFDRKAWTVGLPVAVGVGLILVAVLLNLWWLSKFGV